MLRLFAPLPGTKGDEVKLAVVVVIIRIVVVVRLVVRVDGGGAGGGGRLGYCDSGGK